MKKNDESGKRKDKRSIMNEAYRQSVMVRMAHHSTAIEGNTLTEEETERLLTGDTPVTERTEVNEVVNYKELMMYLLAHEKENITLEDIKEINRILLACIDGRGGHFKTLPNTVGGTETTPPYMVREEMKKWTDDLSFRLSLAETNEEKVEIIMDQHIRFERIHPFPDGNGRTGRALIIRSCLQHDLALIIIEKEQRPAYIKALNDKNTKELTRISLELQKKEMKRKRKFVI